MSEEKNKDLNLSSEEVEVCPAVPEATQEAASKTAEGESCCCCACGCASDEEKDAKKGTLTTEKSASEVEKKKEKVVHIDTQKDEKKPLKAPRKKGKILFSVVAIVLVLAVVCWGSFMLGLPQKFFPPMHVGSRAVSVQEYNYFYNSAYQQYNNFVSQGMIPSKTGKLDMDALTGLPDEKYKDLTWGEFVDQMAQLQIRRIEMLNARAEAEGMKLSEENQKKIDTQADEAIKHYGSKLEAENALVKIYGKGITIESMKEIMKKLLIAQQYTESYPEKIEISDEEIQKQYESEPDRYNVYTYRSFTFSLPQEVQSDPKAKPEVVEAQRKEDMAKLKEQAEQFKKEITDEASFIAAAEKFAPLNEQEAYKNPNHTLHKNESFQQIGMNPAGKWLMEKNRKAGDVDLSESFNSYTVVYFISSGKNETHLPSMGRMIFNLQAMPNAQTAEAKEAKEKALSALEETAKAELPKVQDKKSLLEELKRLKDEGESVVGGWLDSTDTAGLTPEQVQWAFTEADQRKTGDQKLFKLEQGWELMIYGKKSDLPAWKMMVQNELRSKKFNELLDQWENEPQYKISVSSIGMKFTDKLAKNSKTGKEVLAEQAQKTKESALPAGKEAQKIPQESKAH